MVDYNESLCKERHKRTDEKIAIHETRINNHSGRIDTLEQHRSAADVEIKNLIKEIGSLVTIVRWFIGMFVGAFVSFFFYAAQAGLIKK